VFSFAFSKVQDENHNNNESFRNKNQEAKKAIGLIMSFNRMVLMFFCVTSLFQTQVRRLSIEQRADEHPRDHG
jgi:hypothetical protein